MKIHVRGLILAVACTAVCGSRASAQLLFGSTTTATTNGAAFYLDVNTSAVTTLWNSATNKKVNDLAADDADGRLYANDAARLNVWNYGNLGITPTFIAGMYRTEDNVSFSATGGDGLAYVNGNLYGATSFPSSTFKRGIYQINTVPDAAAHCVMTPLWVDNTGTAISLGDLDYNAADNRFYVTSTNDTTGSGGTFGLGLYSIDAFGSGTVTKIADFPAGRRNVDGLAIGGGKFWMTEHEPGASRIDIYPYDPVSGTYGATIFMPLTDATQRATGATWSPNALPEPASIGVLAFLGLVLARRRGSSR